MMQHSCWPLEKREEITDRAEATTSVHELQQIQQYRHYMNHSELPEDVIRVNEAPGYNPNDNKLKHLSTTCSQMTPATEFWKS